MRRASAPAGRDGRDPDGGARSLHVLRQLRVALPRRGRDSGRGKAPRGQRRDLPQHVRNRRPDELGGRGHLARQEDRGSEESRDRRGGHRTLRQVGIVTRGRLDPSPSPRHRPAGDLPVAHGAGRQTDPRMARTRQRVPCRRQCLFRLPGEASEGPGRRGRGWVHRPGDGGEPCPSRVRGDASGDARSRAAADRSGECAHGRGAPQETRRTAGVERRCRWVQADRRWRARGGDQVRGGPSGRYRDPLARRAPRHRAGENGGAGTRGTGRHPRWTSTCGRATPISSPWATWWRSRTM